MNMLFSASQWSQDESLAYEAACECITDLIGILMDAVYQEEANCVQNSQRLTELRAAVSRFWKVREQLGVQDHSAIAKIREEYSSKIRIWRESGDIHRANDAILQSLTQVAVVSA